MAFCCRSKSFQTMNDEYYSAGRNNNIHRDDDGDSRMNRNEEADRRNMEVKVAHGVVMKSVFVDEQRATFGTLKQEICRMSEVPVQYQRILWRGREREDHEKLSADV